MSRSRDRGMPELAAVDLLLVGAPLYITALWTLCLRKLANVFAGMQEFDNLVVPVLIKKIDVTSI